MRKNNAKVSEIARKHSVKNTRRIKKKIAKEDAHIDFLWRKIKGGLQLDFNKKFSRRVLNKLISLQEMERHNEKKQVQ